MKKSHNKEIQSYTIGQLAKLAGVSARTLRYYEDEGLIHPLRTSTNYRIYHEKDARRLAQILAMRACGLPLTTIRHLLEDLDADIHGASCLAPLFSAKAEEIFERGNRSNRKGDSRNRKDGRRGQQNRI